MKKSTQLGIVIIIEKLVWCTIVLIPFIKFSTYLEESIPSTRNLIIILAITWFLYYCFAYNIWEQILKDWENTMKKRYNIAKNKEDIKLAEEEKSISKIN